MLVGVVDVGSNTVRLLVARVDGGSIDSVVSDKAYLGLGGEIAVSGSLSDASVEAAARVCRAYAKRAAAEGVERAEVIVTAPGRQGDASTALLARLRARTRLPVRILTADDEGRLAYEGAVACAVERLPDSVAVVDVGGGSTEIVVGRGNGALCVDSIDLGSLRLTRLALPNDPPSKRELRTARALARETLAPLKPPRADAAFAVGGGARALAKLVGRTFGTHDADAAIEILARRKSAKVAREVGIDARRAQTVLAGTLLLGEASRLLGSPLTLARGGLREGAALALAREDAVAAA